ncbi:MAG TPA: hypothetical protein VF881_03530 [Polyangiaceae bacterium]
MKIVRFMFPAMLALTTGCATTLDQGGALRPNAEARNEAAVPGGAPACFVSGEMRTIAPKAQVRPGIEVVTTATGIALGFSRTPFDAVAMTMDPSSGVATERFSRHTADPIRHITPIHREGDAIDAAIDAECKANTLKGAVTISARESFVVGTTDGEIAWAACASELPHTLWHFSQGAVRELRGIALRGGGYAIAFREGESIWLGRVDADKNPLGPLHRIATRAELRAPVLAESGEDVLVVWSEQRNGSDRWSLGGASVAQCGHATPMDLAIPMENADADAIQPALAAVDANHFLLVWTEGPVWGRQVRAVTIESHGRAVGPALRVSAGAESGWARPAITADGRGAVVYLVPTSSGFAIAATPIECSSSGRANRVAAARL